MGNNAIVNNELLRPAEALVAASQEANATRATDPLQVFIALDEVLNLAYDSTGDPAIIIAFRRVMHLLRSLPIWEFLVTAQSPLHHIAPSIAAEKSDPIFRWVCKRILPFVSFMTEMGLTGQTPKVLMTRPLGEYLTV